MSKAKMLVAILGIFGLTSLYASQFSVSWSGFTAAGGDGSSTSFRSDVTVGESAGMPMKSLNFLTMTGFQAPPPSIRFATSSSINADSNWRMFSLFYEPETEDLATLFPDARLKFFVWDPNAPATEDFLKFVKPSKIEPGRALWIKLPDASASFNISGLALDQEEPFVVKLGAGWNQVANPFVFPIPFGSVQVVANGERLPLQDAVSQGLIKGVIFFFDGKGYVQFDDATGVLQPGEGYFVFVQQPLGLIYYPVQANPQILKQLSRLKGQAHRSSSVLKFNSAGSGEWTLKLSAENSHAKDSDNFLGVRLSAKNKVDALDVPEPPQLENDLALYFEEEGRALANSFKSTEARWRVVVTSKHNKLPVTLSWNGDERFLEQGAVLIDWQRQDFVDMTQQSSYTFQLPATKRAEFEIRAGRDAEGLFKLEEAFNFPNPTSSDISFIFLGKGKPGPMEVEFFSAAGRPLMNTVLYPVSAGKGRYKARAREVENSSKSWANGVYFYRIKASNGLGGKTVRTGKMVLLR